MSEIDETQLTKQEFVNYVKTRKQRYIDRLVKQKTRKVAMNNA